MHALVTFTRARQPASSYSYSYSYSYSAQRYSYSIEPPVVVDVSFGCGRASSEYAAHRGCSFAATPGY